MAWRREVPLAERAVKPDWGEEEAIRSFPPLLLPPSSHYLRAWAEP